MKIFVMAGTEDGRKLAEFLSNNGCEVTASVVSDYGKKLLEQYENISVNDKTLDAAALTEILTAGNFNALVDASHPYAVNASKTALDACNSINLPYVRFEREMGEYERLSGCYHVADYEQAAIKAAELGKNIFLTTGSRNLKIFVERLKNCNITARILPTAEVLAQCEKLGLTPKQIIAMQGPFSTEMNIEMFKHAQAEVIVTKDSGKIGGADTKIAAAQILNLPVVVIDRPKIFYPNVAATFDEVLNFLKVQKQPPRRLYFLNVAATIILPQCTPSKFRRSRQCAGPYSLQRANFLHLAGSTF